jgi:hypothetical protein
MRRRSGQAPATQTAISCDEARRQRDEICSNPTDARAGLNVVGSSDFLSVAPVSPPRYACGHAGGQTGASASRREAADTEPRRRRVRYASTTDRRQFLRPGLSLPIQPWSRGSSGKNSWPIRTDRRVWISSFEAACSRQINLRAKRRGLNQERFQSNLRCAQNASNSRLSDQMRGWTLAPEAQCPTRCVTVE